MEFGQILIIIGILGLIDSTILFLLPKGILKIRKKRRDKKVMKKIGWIEFAIATTLFIIGMNI